MSRITHIAETTAATNATLTVSGLVTVFGVSKIDEAIGATILVMFVTLASRLLVELVNSQDKKFSFAGILITIFKAILSAILVAIVTITIGLSIGETMPIIAGISTVFGAQPKLLVALMVGLGRKINKRVDE